MDGPYLIGFREGYRVERQQHILSIFRGSCLYVVDRAVREFERIELEPAVFSGANFFQDPFCGDMDLYFGIGNRFVADQAFNGAGNLLAGFREDRRPFVVGCQCIFYIIFSPSLCQHQQVQFFFTCVIITSEVPSRVFDIPFQIGREQERGVYGIGGIRQDIGIVGNGEGEVALYGFAFLVL